MLPRELSECSFYDDLGLSNYKIKCKYFFSLFNGMSMMEAQVLSSNTWNIGQIIILIFEYFIGQVALNILFSFISSSFKNIDSTQKIYENKLKLINKQLEFYDIKGDIPKLISVYYEYIWNKHSCEIMKKQHIKNISSSMKEKISIFKFKESLRFLNFLDSNVEDRVIALLFKFMELRICIPNELIFLEGDVTKGLYILSKGKTFCYINAIKNYVKNEIEIIKKKINSNNIYLDKMLMNKDERNIHLNLNGREFMNINDNIEEGFLKINDYGNSNIKKLNEVTNNNMHSNIEGSINNNTKTKFYRNNFINDLESEYNNNYEIKEKKSQADSSLKNLQLKNKEKGNISEYDLDKKKKKSAHKNLTDYYLDIIINITDFLNLLVNLSCKDYDKFIFNSFLKLLQDFEKYVEKIGTSFHINEFYCDSTSRIEKSSYNNIDTKDNFINDNSHKKIDKSLNNETNLSKEELKSKIYSLKKSNSNLKLRKGEAIYKDNTILSVNKLNDKNSSNLYIKKFTLYDNEKSNPLNVINSLRKQSSLKLKNQGDLSLIKSNSIINDILNLQVEFYENFLIIFDKCFNGFMKFKHENEYFDIISLLTESCRHWYTNYSKDLTDLIVIKHKNLHQFFSENELLFKKILHNAKEYQNQQEIFSNPLSFDLVNLPSSRTIKEKFVKGRLNLTNIWQNHDKHDKKIIFNIDRISQDFKSIEDILK